ncbi:MAG: ABC transporter ATP-binding protein [Lachnospiraceae bacterium]|nr:ABC transporter ATP-binding protein [Lachnospiraceae bacterium]
MSILELKNVSYTYKNRYQSVTAVDSVNYAFDTGKVYALVGKSGSGKTTLLSMLSGLDLPTEGEVLYEGVSTEKMNRDRYRREDVAVIYQGFNLFPLMTVRENVMYPVRLQGKSRAEAKKTASEMLEKVGLTPQQARRFPSMLSGGEQQRVAIARALAANSHVILADEPTGNLDVENSRNIAEILCHLAHEMDYCVIIVTHDLAVAELADIQVRMKDGRLLPEGEEAPKSAEKPENVQENA